MTPVNVGCRGWRLAGINGYETFREEAL